MKKSIIKQRQNDIEALKMLLMQRQFHRYSKLWVIVKISVLVILPISAGLLESNLSFIIGFSAPLTFLAILLDVSLIEPLSKIFKNKAINIQEQFDCFVYRLKWPEFKINEKIDYNSNCKLSIDEIKEKSRKEKIYDWYTLSANSGDRYSEILSCQRQNLVASVILRGDYKVFIIILISLIVLTELVIFFCVELSFVKMINIYIIPILPLIVWSAKELSGIFPYLNRIDKLLTKIHNNRKSFFNTVQLRSIQDEIIELRKCAPVIFDWHFKLRRNLINKVNSSNFGGGND